MQIIQFSLGNNVHPLGVISSLSNYHKMELRKNSHFLHARSSFISPIQAKPPLAKSSKFFLTRENEPSIQPLIGWDNQDINSEFSLLETNSFNPIAPPDNNNFNSSKSVKDSISKKIPERIDKNNRNKTSSEINIKGKSESKKTNKSKPIKSSATKNHKKLVDQKNIPINFNQDSLLTSDEPISVQVNSEIPILQLNVDSDNSTVNNIITPIITAYTSPHIKDKSTLSRNIANDELQFDSELPSSLPSAESFIAESILPSKEKIELDKETSELVEDLPIDCPLLNNVQETFTPSRSFTQNEQQVIPEVSELVGISDIPVSPTPSRQDIKTYNSPPIANNKNTDFKTNSIQAKEVLPSLNSPSLSKELPHTNSNSETITPIELNVILQSTSNNFVADNVVADNSLEDAALSSVLTSPDIDNTLYSLANNKNTAETHSNTPKTCVAVPNPESSIAKSPITIQQEIGSSITSESPPDTPVQLTPTSADIENTPSLLANSDNNEQLVTSELQSAMAVNFLDATSPEIGETTISNDKPLGVNVPLPITSPEIAETPLTATLPEIGETAISNDKPLGVNAPLPITSPEIGETTISNDKPLGVNAPLPITSSEIGEAQVVSAIPPEIGEAAISNDKPLGVNAPLPITSSEIGEAQVVNAIPPEIGETTISNDKPLSVNAPLSITSPEINETIVKSEFPSAVTNPEIPTFVDTSDNLTSPQDEVSTAPEVEQNTTIENMPAPKGYATGGHVTNSHVENRQQIAPSDTVPAMLTPGEFVINTRDAQKNLPLLHLINTGGTLQDIIPPSLQTPNSTESKERTSPETPTKVDSFPHTPSQLKSTETHSPQISNSLIPSSLGLDIGKQKLSILNSPQLNPLQNETSDVGEASPQYSSPPMIFRKPNPSTNSPSQWSSVEDLLNANNDEFTSFNFNDVKSNNQNQKFSHVSQSPQVFAKHLPSPRGFANGGEVTPPDISREIEPVTETIESGSSSPEEGDKDDTADLEALAREIYNRLRQRIEIERERHGGHSGRLPW
ncbi:MAG: hypothetical protein ICV54_04820 [Nostoc sp. C3-bin3]|nr:hypothetical protein [Nostoc sp. C3-bin3]